MTGAGMDKERLVKHTGENVRLDPPAEEYDASGTPIREVDCLWRVEAVRDKKLMLVQVGGNYVLELGFDHVASFKTDAEGRADGVLMLSSWVYLQDGRVRVQAMHPLPLHVGKRGPGPTRWYRLARARLGTRRPGR